MQAPGDVRPKRAMRGIIKKRPLYGTRRMAAQPRRETGARASRKRIQRPYRGMGPTSPALKVGEVPLQHKDAQAERPLVGKADTSYVWCGVEGRCCPFNAIDVHARQRPSYDFSARAKSAGSVAAPTGAAADRGPDASRLTLRADDGRQYTSRKFRGSGKARHQARVRLVITPEQNGHIESFRKTLKKERAWPEAFESFGRHALPLPKPGKIITRTGSIRRPSA